jgi:uncharacterized protein DUF4114/PEP-CTERM motif-containing protein
VKNAAFWAWGAISKGNCLISRNRIMIMCAGLTLLLMGLPAPKSAEATPATLGADLYSTGGNLQIEILPFSAGFTNELHLSVLGVDHFIGTNRDVGTIFNLALPAGESLDFSIFVRNTGHTFHLASPGNPDGIAHGSVEYYESAIAEVGFEDLFGGGDRDFNDLVFLLSGAGNGSVVTPEPASLVLMGSGVMFLIGWRWRRSTQQPNA